VVFLLLSQELIVTPPRRGKLTLDIMGMEDMVMDMDLLITPMDMLTVMLAALCMAIHHITTITMARGKLTQKLRPTLDMPFLMDTHTLWDILILLDILIL
jgi:hypothetical protein